jgi:ribosomal protein L11 methyltransferase
VLSCILESEHDDMVRRYTTLAHALSHVGTARRGDAAGEAWVAITFQSRRGTPPPNAGAGLIA